MSRTDGSALGAMALAPAPAPAHARTTSIATRTRQSLARIAAVFIKELIQMRRDRVTFAMMIGIPIIQLLIFGFAINNDPKHLPTALFIKDHSAYTRAIVNAFENSRYFDIVAVNAAESDGDGQIERGEVAFVLTIPDGFTKALLRGERPQLLLEADATDPAAASNAVAAASQLANVALQHQRLAPAGITLAHAPFELITQRRYNPEGITQYNIVPGLLGVILTMTMVMMTAMALTREVERGTMENLLAMPARPLEVMVGKVTPYLGVGAVQVVIILGASTWVFGVPMLGSYTLLMAVILLFIAALATLGYLISTLSRSQMQAMQLSFFFFLPSILLSGFMFPFRGMPDWAQVIGHVLPLTYFLRIVRGVMLKGAAFADIAVNVWPLLIFLLIVGVLALNRYRSTLDG